MVSDLMYLLLGLILLVWSADWFVDGSSQLAVHLGIPPLLIGIIIVGFGTSAPEMMVSAIASAKGNPSLALGNAYGSNICNIALILGISAWISPVAVSSAVLKKELPLLTLATFLSAFLIMDGRLTKWEAGILISVFAAVLAWSIFQQKAAKEDPLGTEVQNQIGKPAFSLKTAVSRLVSGLVILILSSQILVSSAVDMARHLGVGDLLIGLTIVAVGTSLPELASSVTAARKNQYEIALGNIVGSNLFNTLCVVGIAGLIRPTPVNADILFRDLPVMTSLTLLLFVLGYGFKGRPGRINRVEGVVLVSAYIIYTGWLIFSAG